eukprot:g2302.t1
MPSVIWWVRNDLRVHDNAVLTAAAKAAGQGGAVLPVYVFDRLQIGPQARSRILQLPKQSVRRAQFTLDAVADLRRSLKEKLGVDLLVRVGTPATQLLDVAEQAQVSTVFAAAEACSEEKAEEAKVVKAGLQLKLVWDSTLLHPEDLPFDAATALPLIYTQFRRMVERKEHWRVRPLETISKLTPAKFSGELGELPTLQQLCGPDATAPEPEHRSVLQFVGGERAALARLQDYVWTQDALKEYKVTRNSMLGANHSSKLSAWLSQGSLSPRMVYAEVKRYENERVANDSTYWLIFELLWRDYFKLLPLRVGDGIFKVGGPRQLEKPWRWDKEQFKAWTEGNTGYPIIDANMRELHLSGWMSNRGRQIVASFLTKDLGIDWRWGAEWFEMHLLDHSPEANYGNWTYSAGVGTDPREDRYFNLSKQAMTYDPQGQHAKHWLQELVLVPDPQAHKVHELPAAARKPEWKLGSYGLVKVPARLGQFAPPWKGGGGGGRKGWRWRSQWQAPPRVTAQCSTTVNSPVDHTAADRTGFGQFRWQRILLSPDLDPAQRAAWKPFFSNPNAIAYKAIKTQ